MVTVRLSRDVHAFLRLGADTQGVPDQGVNDVEISLDPSQSSFGVAYPPPSPGGGPGAAGLQTLATDLGVSTGDLTAARTSGQSLSDFATSKGASQDTLLAALKDSIATNAPAGAPALSSDQLNAMATDMVNRKPGAGGHHHHHLQMPDSSLLSALAGTTSTSSTSATDQTLSQLLQNLTGPQGADSTDSSSDSTLQQLLQQLDGSSSSYGADGSTPALSGSIGLNAFA
jgi:hypothetical protein